MGVMTKKSIRKIVMIGAGRLASQLAQELKKAGFQLVQVYSRTQGSAKSLASELSCLYTSRKDRIRRDADLFVLALTDEGTMAFIREFDFPHVLAVHTSGGLSLNVFDGKIDSYGVLYPLQSFTFMRSVNFREIPFCIEGNNKATEEVLCKLSSLVSDHCFNVSSEQRLKIHLAAVFASNFTNHMYVVASSIMEQTGLPFQLLQPLIRETAERLETYSPTSVQTGPAIRNDQTIIKKHLELLSFSGKYQELYKIISESIQSFKERNKKL